MAVIGRDPLRYPVYEGKPSSRIFRRARVERFPYIVVYQVRHDETLVVAVAHSTREPGYWTDRNNPQQNSVANAANG